MILLNIRESRNEESFLSARLTTQWGLNRNSNSEWNSLHHFRRPALVSCCYRFFSQLCGKIVEVLSRCYGSSHFTSFATSQYQRREDVLNLTLRLQLCTSITITRSIIWCTVNLLSKVEARLKQRCEFCCAVLVLLYQRHYKVGCWLYDVATLPQRCHKFVCLLEHFTKISAS